MDSDFFTGGYSAKQELERLEKRLIDLRDEMSGAYENSRGRSRSEIEEEILKVEASIELLGEGSPEK